MFILNLVILCISGVDGAKILGVFIMPSISHQIVFQPIWRELSLRGHEVTVITPYPLGDPTLVNLTEIDVSSVREMFRLMNKPYVESIKMSPWLMAAFYYPSVSQVIQAELELPAVQALINDKTKYFDVVLIEALHPLLYAFGGRFNCPMVGLLSQYAGINVHFALGNPSHPIAAPEIQLRFTENLSFFERVESVLFSLFLRNIYRFLVLPLEDRAARKHFGDNIAYLGDLEKNLSVLLTNTHPLIHGIRPNVPTVVELGKIQRLRTNQTLSHDLKRFLDLATEGVVYFSLGSLIKSEVVLADKLDFIKETFSELPQKILWKCDNDVLPSQPENVIIRNWVPQEEVLKHPNVKLFITQGGPQSIEEALIARVPLLAMPIHFDQFSLSKRVTAFGIGRILDIEYFDKDSFKEAIVDIMSNSSYKEKAEELATLLEDQPTSGLENAIWWIEYVIRHKGAKNIQSQEIDVPSYQYYHLDILVVVTLVVSVLFYSICKVVSVIIKHLLKLAQRKLKRD